ncbi:MAG: tetratricopeptide repeat protein [Bacillota bacterium]|nr:tetratricopeptide repeat protein [Bacillota bacterium]
MNKRLLMLLISLSFFIFSLSPVSAKTTIKAKDYFNLGMKYYKQYKYDDALKNFNLAISLDSKYIDAYLYKGLAIYWGYNDFNEAITCYDKAIQLSPKYPDVYYWKGNALYCLEEFKEAIKNYDIAIKLKPKYAEAYGNKGQSLEALENYKDALTNYKKALQLNPNLGYVYHRIGRIYLNSKNYKEALQYFNKAITLIPKYAPLYKDNGDALYYLGKFEEALNSYNNAIKLNPNYAEATYKKCIVLATLDKTSESMQSLKDAVEIDKSYLFQAVNEQALKKIINSDEFYNKFGDPDVIKLFGTKFMNYDILSDNIFKGMKFTEVNTTGNIDEDNSIKEKALKILNDLFGGNIYDSLSADNCNIYDSQYKSDIIDIGSMYKNDKEIDSNLNVSISNEQIIAVGSIDNTIKTVILKVHENITMTGMNSQTDEYLILLNTGGTWKYFWQLFE